MRFDFCRPAKGTFTVEHAVNRVFTTLAPFSPDLGVFGDGKDHPGLGVTRDGKKGHSDCIVEPNSMCMLFDCF